MTLPYTETTGINDLIFKCHQPALVREVAFFVPVNVLATVIADYITSHEDCFGAEQWREYFGVDVVDKNLGLNPYEFYSFWFESDPIDPTKQICDTHLRPIFRPRITKYIRGQIPDPYSLRSLGQMIQRPRKGHPARYVYHNARAFNEHGLTKVKSSCWVVMRREVLAKGKSYSEQEQAIADLNKKPNVGYEKFSSVIDIATALCVNHCMTGERLLGDNTGVEKIWTCSQAKEIVVVKVKESEKMKKTYQFVERERKCHVLIGGFSASVSTVNKTTLASLRIGHTYLNEESIGIVPIRIFNVI